MHQEPLAVVRNDVLKTFAGSVRTKNRHFERAVTMEVRIARAIDFPYPASAERPNDFVRAKTCPPVSGMGCRARFLYCARGPTPARSPRPQARS